MTIIKEIAARGGILVAHDGSSEADAALATAIRCAPGFDRRVAVVRAWDMVSTPMPPGFTPTYIPPLEDFEAATLKVLEEDVAAVRAKNPQITISCLVVHGNVAERLVEASHHVDMIVLGSRGHGGFVGLLLGSVTDQVVHHARCRVLVDRQGHPVTPENDADSEPVERALVSELGLGDPDR